MSTFTTVTDTITTYAQWGNNTIGLPLDILNAEMMLKKGFTWGRAVNPVPEIDFILGAAGQAVSDSNNPNLTFDQRIRRAGVVGLESVVTGYVSDIVGGGGFLLGGLIANGPGAVGGYALVALGTSLYLDEVEWKKFNNRNFEGWGLGPYP